MPNCVDSYQIESNSKQYYLRTEWCNCFVVTLPSVWNTKQRTELDNSFVKLG